MRIVYGLIGNAIGFLLIKYSVLLTDNLGKIDWAEEYLGSGLSGTYSFYRISGLVIIVLSMLYMFNLFGFITNPLTPLFGGLK